MKEQLISLETAKLAKQKGFNWPTAKAYDRCDMLCTYNPIHDLNYNTSGYIKSAPTQALLAKWLRDEHQISCLADSNHSGWFWMINKTNGTRIKDQTDYLWFASYEAALEAGLLQALNLL